MCVYKIVCVCINCDCDNKSDLRPKTLGNLNGKLGVI